MATRLQVVVGAGGPSGSRFIEAAITELAAATGFDLDHAETIIGTSAGAFAAAAADPAVGHPDTPLPPSVVIDKIRTVANGDTWRRRPTDRPVTHLRLLGGRLVALAAVTNRPPADYRTPGTPHHSGALVVSVTKPTGRRFVHHLATSASSSGAVRASAAVPFVTGPVILDGEAHLDGAIHSPTNTDLISCGPDDVLVVIAPMIATAGGTLFDRLHRSQLRTELSVSGVDPASIVVIAPAIRRPRSTRLQHAAADGVNAVRDLIDGKQLSG